MIRQASFRPVPQTRENHMRAVGFNMPQPIGAETSLLDIELPMPVAAGHDLLVEIKAVSVNPVDTNVRSSAAVEAGQYRVLGYDAAGVRSEEHTSELQSLMRISYAVFCLKKKNTKNNNTAVR